MDRLKKFAIHLLLLLGLLATASLAHADEELNIAPSLKHDGLTFEQSLPDGIIVESEATSSFQKVEFAAFLDDIPEEIEPTKVKSEPTPTPVKKPTPSVTPSPTPRSASTPSPTLNPTAVPTTQTGSNTSNGGLNADILFSMSNSYRSSKGLPAFQTDARICSLAQARAPQISAEISEGHMHSGKNSHNFPYWFTENIITMRTEQEAFSWWVNDHIHRVQIEEPNTHSCVACSGNACVQHFTSFQQK